MRSKRIVVDAVVASVLICVQSAALACQAPAGRTAREDMLGEYVGTYQRAPDVFVYLQL